MSFEASRSDTLNSPQGDGNPTGKCFLHSMRKVRHPQFPARGRKQRAIDRMRAEAEAVRHPQFPARGRKLYGGLSGPISVLGQTPSIPRKGTETENLR